MLREVTLSNIVENRIELSEKNIKLLEIIKAQQGFENISQAISFSLKSYKDNFLEIEYIKRIRKLRKSKHQEFFKIIDEIKKLI